MVNVAILGASGFTGLELIKILDTHPHFNISFLGGNSQLSSTCKTHRILCDVVNMDIQKVDVKNISEDIELVFLALPHQHSMEFAKQFLSYGVKVVDLSADYRLDLDNYEKHYCKHTDKQNIAQAVYGLPECYEDDIKTAKLIANPGCYPTSALLGLLPFVDFVDEKSPIFIDAKSGVSGAGKKVNELTSFTNINENMFAYNPLKHRHTPEIIQKIQDITSVRFDIHFVPHLIPLTTGMLSSIYVTLKDTDIDAVEVLKSYYKDKHFVRVREDFVQIKDVVGTNFCDVYVKQDKNILFINTAIDNILRGASSQAVVNANIMYGYPQRSGLGL